MKTNRTLLRALLLCLCTAFLTTGCGDDEETNLFPEGTAALRMMNESNGKTILGNSDLYITDSGNFYSEQFPLFDMGEKRGLSDIGMPDFINMSHEVAVNPKHGYLLCDSRDITTFSGSQTYAIARNSRVYRFYVDSWIQENGKNIGANVFFLLGNPDKDCVLPEWDSTIAVLNPNWEKGEFTGSLTLPGARAEDLEVEFPNRQTEDMPMQYDITGNVITFRLDQAEWDYITKTFRIRIRHKHIYTEGILQLAD